MQFTGTNSEKKGLGRGHRRSCGGLLRFGSANSGICISRAHRIVRSRFRSQCAALVQPGALALVSRRAFDKCTRPTGSDNPVACCARSRIG